MDYYTKRKPHDSNVEFLKYSFRNKKTNFLPLRMDLQDQLKKLFPEHESEPESNSDPKDEGLWIQDEPLECHYEKRKGKPVTVIKGYTGHTQDFKQLAKELKQMLGVGGSFKDEAIIIQGDYRNQIMDYLKDNGFKVKRVGG